MVQRRVKKVAAAICLSAAVLTSVPAVAMAVTAGEPINQQTENVQRASAIYSI